MQTGHFGWNNLGIWFDRELSSWEHLKQAEQKVDQIMGMLSMLLPHIGGPLIKKRRLLVNMSVLIALYGISV